MESSVHDDEQWECLDVSARGLRLLKSGLWADVEFQVGESKEIIKAHSLILSSASSVFEDMLNGSSAESVSPIPVPDVTPEVFNLMLEFMYSDKIQLAHFEQVPEIEYVAKKYRMRRLLEAAGVGLIKSMNPDIAIKCYEFATSIMCQPLVDECTKVFKYQTAAVLASKSFLTANLDTVEYIFSLEKLALVSETELWAALTDYVEANDINKTEDGVMNVSLCPLLRHIRFLDWYADEMVEHCSRFRKLLSDFEVLCLISNRIKTETMPEMNWMSQNSEQRTLNISHNVLPIIGEIKIGRLFKFHGCFQCECQFQIDFNKMQEDFEESTIFQMCVTLDELTEQGEFSGHINRNTCNMGSWGEYETEGRFSIKVEEPLDIAVVIESEHFQISVNGEYFCLYAHRMPYTDITHCRLDLHNFELKKIFL